MHRNIFFGEKEGSVKNLVIRILSNKWPLTAKKIYNIIKNRYNYNVSYQAVHKAIKQLVGDGILSKNNKEVSINLEWIENLKTFSENVRKHYLKGSPLFLPGLKEFREEGEVKTFIFDNLKDADTYRKQLQREFILDKSRKNSYCGMSFHLKSPLIFSEQSLKSLRMVKEHKVKCFIIVKGDSAIDKWCANYYKKDFIDVKTNVKFHGDCDVMVLDDIITQMYIPNKIQQDMDKFHLYTKNVSEIDIPEMNKNIFEIKAKIKFVVFRNPDIAEQLRRSVISNFREDKIAVFDIDGVLVETPICIDFYKYLSDRGVVKRSMAKSVEKLIKNHYSGKMSYTKLSEKYSNTFVKFLKGMKQKDFQKLATDFITENSHKYMEMKNIFDFVHSFRKTVAITSNPSELVKAMRAIFPFDHIIPIKFETKRGVYTGKIIRDFVSKDSKTVAFQKFVKSNEINLEDSLGFGDTEHDAGFMKMVETAVAMNPKKKFKEMAEKNKWIIYTKKESKDVLLKKIKKRVLGY
ncbi:HAD family hydrolase [Candidatus Aenigmatarchaeota archaeon]